MAYSVGNFFLTVQWMKQSTILTPMVYLTSLADLALITALIAALTSYSSSLYVFYFPAILALAVTFPRQVTALYTLGTLGAYAAVFVTKVGDTLDAADGQTLTIRLLLLAATAFCGALYQHLESDRRAGKGRMFTIFPVDAGPEVRNGEKQLVGAGRGNHRSSNA